MYVQYVDMYEWHHTNWQHYVTTKGETETSPQIIYSTVCIHCIWLMQNTNRQTNSGKKYSIIYVVSSPPTLLYIYLYILYCTFIEITLTTYSTLLYYCFNVLCWVVSDIVESLFCDWKYTALKKHPLCCLCT